MRLALCTAVAAGALLLAISPSWAKTAKECNAEYAANKAAIKGAQKKGDFITACKAGTEVIPAGAVAAPAPAAPAPAPTTTSAPVAPPPKPASRVIPMTKPAAPRTATAPVAPAAPTAANQFSTDAQAKGRCPTGTVVWVNTKSGVYHFAGTRDYGNTKAGAYMCETDATAAGDRASKTEKHP